MSYKFYFLGEASYASKIVKIARQQTLGLLLSNSYRLVFELLLSDFSSEFYPYLQLQNSDSREISVVGKLRHEATSSIFQENPLMPLRQSKSLVNKHLDCYCPTLNVSFLNSYCLTSSQIFNYIWSYRTPIQARLVSLESQALRLHVL